MSTALAVRDDQDAWDDKQLAVLSSIGLAEVPPGELAMFLDVCQRTRLNPFARQVYLIPRWNSELKRAVWTPQVSIDGLRLIARRACDQAGEQLRYDPFAWCGDDGAWVDVWLSDRAPSAARVVLYRAGQRFDGIATWREYAPRNQKGELLAMWRKMGAHQLAKCAEALALRRACPQELASVYAEEELAQAGVYQPGADPIVRRRGKIERIWPEQSGPAGPDDEWADQPPDQEEEA